MLSWLFWNCFWKFKQTIQNLGKLLALESHQKHAPINCDKFFKFTVQLPSIFSTRMHTFFWCDLSFFFYFAFSTNSFFLLFLTHQTTKIQNLKNFLSMYLIFITQNSQNRICKNRGILILKLKTEKETSKTQWSECYRNFYGSIIQIWTQTKRKNAPKEQNKSEFNLNTQIKTRNKWIKKSTTKICWHSWNYMTRQNI